MTFRKRNLADNKGFTLVELVVIIGIIAVVSTITIAAIDGFMNSNALNQQNSRSMYYYAQSVMSDIRLTSALQKDSDGNIKLCKDPSGSPFAFDENMCYYVEIGVVAQEMTSFRFIAANPYDHIDFYEAVKNPHIPYGSLGVYYAQSEIPATGNIAENDTAWQTLRDKFASAVVNDETDGYYFVAIDSSYRVTKAYYAPVPFAEILGKDFSGDGFIDNVGKIGTFPLSFSKQWETVGG